MARFHHHPDGVVIVEGAAGLYIDTRENFAADYGEAAPALPEGMAERLYVPGGRHVLADAFGNAFPQVGDGAAFPFGDGALAALETIIAAKAAREGQ